MASLGDWQVPPSARPKQADYGYDLDRALSAVLAVHTKIPEDAFTADTLGTERMGHGVLIRDRGVVLTIGYLVTEAEEVWPTRRRVRRCPATRLPTTRRPVSVLCSRSPASSCPPSRSAARTTPGSAIRS